MSDESKPTGVHYDALMAFDRIQAAQKVERRQCLQDRRFYSIAGAQWEGDLKKQFQNKPMFEFNKIHLAVIRIFNEYRGNRITVNFVSKDGSANDEMSDSLDSLYRADEQDSNADEAYDNSFEESVGGGIGAWRYRTVYEDEEDPSDERQRIVIEPIYDADSCVFFDLDAKRQDKADARYCFVLTAMTREAYREEYKDDPISWPKDEISTVFDWDTDDSVYVAEYYKIEEELRTTHFFRHADGSEEKFSDEELEEPGRRKELRDIGSREVRKKKYKKKTVYKYIMSGGAILEEKERLAGSCIPIVPVYGKRTIVDNVERAMGHVRLAKDVQRLKNMQLSKLAELSALSSTEKPIFTPEQVLGHENRWKKDNIRNYPYMLVNQTEDSQGNVVAAGPIGYTKPPTMPQTMAALLQIVEIDINDILGNQQAGERPQANISAETIGLVQAQIGLQTFIYLSNMARSMKRGGVIWLSMARDIYVEPGRRMKTVGLQKEVGTVELMKPTLDKVTGEEILLNDLSKAKYDVSVDVGPSSVSKKQSFVRTIGEMLVKTTDPQVKQVLELLLIMNIEGEGIGEVRDFFRKRLVRMKVIKPTAEEKAQLAEEEKNAKPDPNAEYLKAAGQAEQAKAAKLVSDIELNESKIQKLEAESIEILAGIQPNAVEEVERKLEQMENVRKQQIALEDQQRQMQQQQVQQAQQPGPAPQGAIS